MGRERETMPAIEIAHPGGPEVLRLIQRPVPRPQRGEVLLRVHAAGVNRPDILQRRGFYPPPPGASDLPGLEVAGEVVACAPEVTRWRVGDRVCALLAGGGYAGFVTVPALQCLPVPSGLDMIEAAAIPETFFTVWHNLFERAHLEAGETCLVHGGSGGIGTTAIQLAAAFGARVFTTAGTEEKCRACERLGATRAVDYRREDFLEVLRPLTRDHGIDVFLDIVGADYLERNIELAAPDARIAIIAFLGGARAELPLRPLLFKRLTLTGSTLRPQSPERKGAIAKALETHVWPLLANGQIRPVIDSVFPLEEAARAHERIEGGEHFGKIVLEVGW